MSDEPHPLPEDSGKVLNERVDFRGATFTEEVTFQDVTFTEVVTFEGATFTKGVTFEGATFTKGANFKGATFTKGANFEGATFTKGANFVGATFTKGAYFAGATFTKGAYFAGATFTGGVNFEDATFTERAAFSGAIFTETAFFDGATFTKWVNFSGATFTEQANFSGATFTERAIFDGATFTAWATFVNSEWKSTTVFDNASFLRTPPLFDGAKLHEGTTWFNVTWPHSPKSKFEARLTVRAYERLKLEMDKLKKHEDELQFFALELQARGVLAGKWSTSQGWAINIYGWLCDYGRSYSRPACLLGAMTVIGAAPFLVHFGLPGLRGSLALSFANTFGILGLRREFFAASVIADLPSILKLFSIIQTVAGAVLFFLFGLGLRNRFRMR